MLVFILAVLYITLTSGVMVNVHYCMGEIASVKYGVDKKESCGTCGMEKKDGCCHVDHKFIKAGDQQISSKLSTHFSSYTIIPTVHQQDYLSFVHSNAHAQYALFHSPPDKRLNSLRIYSGVFRI